MTSAVDMIGHSPALQEHWIRRGIALIVDLLLVFVVLLVFNAAFRVFSWPWFWWALLFGLVWLFYAVLLEAGWGATIGKRIVKLHVVGIDTPMDTEKALLRNVSKLNAGILFLDWLLGFVTSGDPRQRYLDRFARTTVARADQQAYLEEQFRAMQRQPPHPAPPPAGAWGQPSTPPGTVPPTSPPPSGPPTAGGWPGQETPSGSAWPKHEWDAEGQLKPQTRFCANCGGQLVPRGDGKLVCVRCGSVY